MKRVVAELDIEPIVYEEDTWGLKPVYWVHEKEQKARPGLLVQLFHRHENPSSRWEYCSRSNARGEPIEYTCNKCDEFVPSFIVNKKIETREKYNGYDPRNNRKAAVLATRNKGNTNA